jgi:hypothetical protein
VIALAAGLVAAPAAAIGLRKLLTGADPRGRAFAWLTLSLLVGLVLEATPFGVNADRVLERYAFYGVPLLGTAFVYALQHGLMRSRARPYLASMAAVAVLLLPVEGPLVASHVDESPTLFGLNQLASPQVWAPPLVAVALLAGWRRITAPVLLAAAAVVCVLAGAGASSGYLRLADRAGQVRADVPTDSALMTWAGADQYPLMQTLFWNRHATRVVVLGSGSAPDTFPFVSAHLTSGPRLETSSGRTVDGPFVFTADGLVIGGGSHRQRGQTLVVRRAPSLVAFGWNRLTGSVGPGAWFSAAGEGGPLRVVVGLRATDRQRKTLGLRCDQGFERTLRVGLRPVRAVVPVPVGSSQTCRFRLLAGGFRFVQGVPVSIRGTLTLRPS